MTTSPAIGGPPREGAATNGAPLLAVSMRGITKVFPGVVANDQVDFDAEVGEVHALLGENGAGKTTLTNVLTGLYRPDGGEIELYGEPVRFQSPRDALEAGIGMVHQHFRLVSPFTVAENVLLGDHRDAGRSFVLHSRRIEQRVAELGAQFGLDVDPRAHVWQLSVGEQQRVEILKALYRDARILILDEPTAVLTPQEAQKLFETLRAMAADGRTVIFISHKLHEVMAVSSRVTVLRRGTNVATVETAASTQQTLAALMVGREVHQARRVARTAPPGDVVLALESVSVAGDRGALAVEGVSFEVREGELVGIAGVAGNGQRELAEAVYGIRNLASGSVRVGGKELHHGDPRSAIAAGVAHIPEDRLGTGLAPSLSISRNVVLKKYRRAPVSRGPLVLAGRMKELALSLIKRYDVQAPGPETPARNLSGGNLQKLVLGREFEGEPRVLIASQPTRGLDVGAIETVHGYLHDASAHGVAVLMISEDLDELMALSDRILVMYEGKIAGEVSPETASVQDIGLLMAGGDA